MELNKIESLIDKYDKGNTSLSEEAQLRSYFSKKSIPQHLVPYKQLFFYFESDSKQSAQRSLKIRYKIQNKFIRYVSVAAALLFFFMALMNIPSKKNISSLSDEELYAYNETIKALELISNKMKEGNVALSNLSIINSSFEMSNINIKILSEFQNSTNSIFKIKNK